jgi:hypothetical protein
LSSFAFASSVMTCKSFLLHLLQRPRIR